ncbi:MAG: inner membrane protein YhjD [Pseudonocardiaceae bacterium]|nr:inner membrane protein YhjD [Pseudonocardiaceae bacterium]
MSGTGPQQTDEQPGMLQRYRQRYPWLDHLVRAGQAYTSNNGDHYAAAITYFSVLALVPLLMIAFAVVAFVLAGNQALLEQLKAQVAESAPPGLGQTLAPVIDQAIESRSSVGIIGLLAALYSGLGWMGNLREALSAQWEQPPESDGFVRKKGFDLLALLGLGLALVASFAVTGAGTAFADVLLDLVGLGDFWWARWLFFLLALALSVAGMWLVFLWVIARLPRQPVNLRSAMKAALFAAVGFEVLKQVFAIYLGSVTQSPTGQLFGPIIGLMVFAFFVSRFLLFVTAWAATARENLQPAPPPPPPPAVIRPQVTVGARPDARSASMLVGLGVLTGGVMRRLFGRRRR